MVALFGVFFNGYSYPITSEHFVQVDQTHWVLDVCSLVLQQYWEVKEVRLIPEHTVKGLCMSKRPCFQCLTEHSHGMTSLTRLIS